MGERPAHGEKREQMAQLWPCLLGPPGCPTYAYFSRTGHVALRNDKAFIHGQQEETCPFCTSLCPNCTRCSGILSPLNLPSSPTMDNCSNPVTYSRQLGLK